MRWPAERRLDVGLLVIALAILGLLGSWALVEWFHADDFWLLLLVQRIDPVASLWPVEARHWWAYRPLGTELYFAWGVSWFGFDARGFHLATLAVHALCAVCLSGVGQRLGLSSWSARLAGVLYLGAPPFAALLICAATFHYQAATLCLLGALWLHLTWLDGDREAGAARRSLARIGAVAVFAVGLLCNQLVFGLVALAGVTAYLRADSRRATPSERATGGPAARPFAFRGARLASALGAALPFLALALLAQGLEWFVFKPITRGSWFGFFPDAALPGRLASLLGLLVGSWPGTWLALAGVVGMLVAGSSWARRAERGPPGNQVLSVCGLWLAGMLGLAALVFYAPHVRYTFPAVPPLCLLVAAGAERGLSRPARPAAMAGLSLLLALAWTPWAQLARHTRAPIGGPYRAGYELVRARRPELKGRILVAHNAPGLAGPQGLRRYRLFSYRFSHLRLVQPARMLHIKVVDLGDGMPALRSTDLLLGLSESLMLRELSAEQLKALADAG